MVMQCRPSGIAAVWREYSSTKGSTRQMHLQMERLAKAQIESCKAYDAFGAS